MPIAIYSVVATSLEQSLFDKCLMKLSQASYYY